MGLDGVELVMATEERFGIEITDQEAETVRTVGDLIELVSNKVAISNESTCFTRKAFYLIRRALIRLTRAPRAAIRPRTEIKSLSPAVNEKQFWQSLQKELGAATWPELQYPGTISFAIGASSILVFVSVLWLWAKLVGLLTLVFGFAMAIAASVLFAQQLMGMTAGLRTEIPDSRQTVGALANYIVNRNPELIAVDREQWTQERIRLCVKEVISDQLGLPVERLHDSASFVDDLGVD